MVCDFWLGIRLMWALRQPRMWLPFPRQMTPEELVRACRIYSNIDFNAVLRGK